MFRKLVCSIAACALATGALAAASITISQKNRAFATRAVQVARAETIHLTNDDEFTHQVYVESAAMTFESDEQNPGEAVDILFPTAGVFEVRCHIHPKMLLTVTVK